MKYVNVVLLALLAAAAGCATTPKTSFYLVPDPDGHVGVVTVANEAATVTLDQANQAVEVERRDTPFSDTRLASDEEIQARFGDALAIVPQPPREFSLFFPSGSSTVDAESLPTVELVLAEIQKRDSRDISLNGHTDRTGDADANMKLSLERANEVRQMLVDRGVSADYMSVEYYGESKPLIPTEDQVSEPKNRRVEVVVR